MGSSTAGGAYVPAMSDETVIVRGHRHDLPRRPAAGEGRDRRGRHARGARRRRGPRPRARASPTTRRSTTSTRSRSVGRSSSNLEPQGARAAVGPARARAAGGRAGRRRPAALAVRRDLGRRPPAGPGPRAHRPARRRLPLPRVQAALRRDARHRLRPPRRLPGRDPRQRRDPVQPVGAQGRPLHRARLPAPDPARVPPEHHRVHGRARVRGGRHRQGRREARDGRRVGRGAEVHGPHRRLVRGRQLRDGRARLPAAVPVDVAELADLGHGRPAGGARAVDGPRRLRRRTRSATPSRRRSSRPTSARARRTSRRPGCGTTASSTRSTRGASWRWASRPRSTRRSRRRGSASSGCEAAGSRLASPMVGSSPAAGSPACSGPVRAGRIRTRARTAASVLGDATPMVARDLVTRCGVDRRGHRSIDSCGRRPRRGRHRSAGA